MEKIFSKMKGISVVILLGISFIIEAIQVMGIYQFNENTVATVFLYYRNCRCTKNFKIRVTIFRRHAKRAYAVC